MKRHIYIALLTVIACTLYSYGQDQPGPVCAESVHTYFVEPSVENSSFDWYIDERYGHIQEGQGTSRIKVKWGYTTVDEDNIISVVEYTNHCSDESSSTVNIDITAPYVSLGEDFPEICADDSLILAPVIETDGIPTFTWHDSSTNSMYIAKETGIIWVRVVDGNGCFRYDTISLLVNPLPRLNLGNDTVLCDQTETLILDPGSFAEYAWHSTNVGAVGNNSFIEITPTLVGNDTISLTVTSYKGCTESDTIIIHPCDLEGMFRDESNSITPNGDGINDVWNINADGTKPMYLFEGASLEVFDRWGRLVFRTENVLEEPWDGTSKGKPLPMDSYYYVLKLKVHNAPPIAGTVNLIR